MQGFRLYDSSHILWLVLCTVCAVLPAAAASRLDERGRKKLLRFLAVLIGVLHVVLALCRWLNGSYDISVLPLQFCGITAYFCVLLEFFPCGFFEGEVFFPGLPGVVLATVFPNWTEYAPFSPISILGFLGHAVIAGYIILRIRAGITRPSRRLALFSALFLGCYMAVMIPFNLHFRVNYGFLCWASPGSPLELLNGLNSAAYRTIFCLILFGLCALWYLIWDLCFRALKKTRG